MLLKEKGELLSDEKQLASIMNKLFINITKSQNLKDYQGSPPVTLNNILKKFVFHPSFDKIRKTYENNKKFSFQQVSRLVFSRFLDLHANVRNVKEKPNRKLASPVNKSAWLHASTLQSFVRRHFSDVNKVSVVFSRDKIKTVESI